MKAQKLTKEQKMQIYCVKNGHAKIVTTCIGYIYCKRCGDQIGDNLMGGMFDLSEHVIDGHGCDGCKENYAKLTRKEKAYCGDPFEVKS